MRDITLYLRDILDAIDAIERFVEGMNLEEFERDDKTSSAVMRKFEIIGEAAKHIPNEVRRKYPDIPWKEMAGFRDKLIHFYFGIEYDIVWNTIKEVLPSLKRKIEEVLKDLKEGEE